MTVQSGSDASLPPLTDDRRRMYRAGVWFFIVSEAMIFVTVFSTRFLLSGTERLLDPLDPKGIFILLVMLASLIPAWQARQHIRRGEADAMARSLSIAAVLGVLALAGIVFDWATLAFAAGSPFGENYIVSTGYHALHIFVGLIWLGSASAAGRRGVHTRENHWVVDGGIDFWFFVVAMWVVLYAIFYLV